MKNISRERMWNQLVKENTRLNDPVALCSPNLALNIIQLIKKAYDAQQKWVLTNDDFSRILLAANLTATQAERNCDCFRR